MTDDQTIYEISCPATLAEVEALRALLAQIRPLQVQIKGLEARASAVMKEAATRLQVDISAMNFDPNDGTFVVTNKP